MYPSCISEIQGKKTKIMTILFMKIFIISLGTQTMATLRQILLIVSDTQ